MTPVTRKLIDRINLDITERIGYNFFEKIDTDRLKVQVEKYLKDLEYSKSIETNSRVYIYVSTWKTSYPKISRRILAFTALKIFRCKSKLDRPATRFEKWIGYKDREELEEPSYFDYIDKLVEFNYKTISCLDKPGEVKIDIEVRPVVAVKQIFINAEVVH